MSSWILFINDIGHPPLETKDKHRSYSLVGLLNLSVGHQEIHDFTLEFVLKLEFELRLTQNSGKH